MENKKLLKKSISVFLTVLTIVLLFSISFATSAAFNPPDVTENLKSECYYMKSLDEGSVVFSKNETLQTRPAALTKVLAAIYAIEKWGNIEESVTITRRDLSFKPSEFSRTAGFVEGDTYTKLQIVRTMLVYSANDAVSVIINRLAGSKETFVSELNNLAKKIKCQNTNIVNPYGFDEAGQFTTAKDAALIMEYGLKNPTFRATVELDKLTLPTTSQSREKTFNTGTSLMNSAPSVKGGKETQTTEAGYCVFVESSRYGYNYVTVVMKGTVSNDGRTIVNTATSDTRAMLEWAYKNLQLRTIAENGTVLKTLPIEGGRNTDTVALTSKETVKALVSSNVSANSVLVELEEGAENLQLTAPLTEGDYVCKATVKYANKTIATVDLVVQSSVPLSRSRLAMQKFSNFMSNGVVITIEVIALVVLLLLLAYHLKNLIAPEKSFDVIFSAEGNSFSESVKKFINSVKNGGDNLKNKISSKMNKASTSDSEEDDEDEEDSE